METRFLTPEYVSHIIDGIFTPQTIFTMTLSDRIKTTKKKKEILPTAQSVEDIAQKGLFRITIELLEKNEILTCI